MAEIQEVKDVLTKTDGEKGSSIVESTKVSVTVRSLKQARINVLGLRDLVNALNAVDAPQEAYVEFDLTPSLASMMVTWERTETQVKKKPVYRNSDDHGGRS